MADFIADGHLEVHLRRSRRRHAARRAALLSAIADHLGTRAQVFGGTAGLHVMLVMGRAKMGEVASLVRRARARGVGVYSTEPNYVTRPSRSEILLGHGSLSEDEMRQGIEGLAAVVR